MERSEGPHTELGCGLGAEVWGGLGEQVGRKHVLVEAF